MRFAVNARKQHKSLSNLIQIKMFSVRNASEADLEQAKNITKKNSTYFFIFYYNAKQ